MDYFNVRGFVMFVLSFGAALAGANVLELPTDTPSNEGLYMMVAGPVLTALDLGYRKHKRAPLVRQPSAGGTFLFLPVWIWGVFWFGLGLGYYLYYSR
jgi:hypothetical protein